jgi:hypothetical protein
MRGDHPIVSALTFYGTRIKHPGQERVHSWLRWNAPDSNGA